ncbi:MAG TPA: neutral zinc metallopeptidase [Acidimicrobiia bacterium]|nr:neutral zinc metallopeptidase [Acidimicrobiia bacterium]
MVKFRKPTQRSGDLVDRRGSPGRRGGLAIGAGGGGIAIIVAILFAVLGGGGGGGGLEDIIGQLQAPTQGSDEAPLDPAADPDADMADFMSVVLDDNQDMWEEIFANSGRQYRRAQLVLFRASTESGCGGAIDQYGPHYCPPDERIYIDLDFFDLMRDQLGAEGDFAPAYVLSHEIAHHVQNVLGLSDEVRRLQQASPDQANDLSVRLELQADCYAGVWSSTVFVGQLETGENIALDPGEVSEALRAAEVVGDDYIRPGSNPDTFTHGTSEQRQSWFQRGYDTGDPASCDTFSGNI